MSTDPILCSTCSASIETTTETSSGMPLPSDISLPFFAYGLFKPGELAYSSIKSCVESTKACSIAGDLLIRDGLPLFVDVFGGSRVDGVIISFKQHCTEEGYKNIAALEPKKLYRWGEIETEQGVAVNVLVGKSPNKGSHFLEDGPWSGRKDPFFNEALTEVETILNSTIEHNSRGLIRLQMAYLMLWVSIERYASLKYHVGNKATKKISRIAEERCFKEGLARYCNKYEERAVFSSGDLQKHTLNPDKPDSSLWYYYQVRSNSVHRGKGAGPDFETVESSLKELLPIFKAMLDDAFPSRDSDVNSRVSLDHAEDALRAAGSVADWRGTTVPEARAVADVVMPESSSSRDLGRKTGLSLKAFNEWVLNQNQSWKFSENTLDVLRCSEFPLVEEKRYIGREAYEDVDIDEE